ERLRARVPADRFKVSTVDLSRILPGPRRPVGPRRCLDPSNDPPRTGSDIDGQALERLRVRPIPTALEFAITNADRAVGARIAGELSRPATAQIDSGGEPCGPPHLLPARVVLHFRGSAGQGFGAFCVEKMRISLEGEANDHVAKGMSGGQIAIFPSRSTSSPVLIGNAALYGATGGSLFVAGTAGERFAVRNSGAVAVVEGVGDHGCEYMTDGRIAVLGPCGRNFGAGMSGGVAYLMDADGALRGRVNSEMVALHSLQPADARELKEMIEAHRDATRSERAAEILENWRVFLPLFRRIAPREASQPLVASSPTPLARPAAHSAGEAAALQPNL
ncbi:MAG TPA: glutamate synthase subunit alpha, partial [Thermoanaerobaculia bacterium]|nr:glutamate synthase subunit alpha [Thermoanaerobaculia bacterium]